MMQMGVLLAALDFLMREAALFAATGFLVLGAADLAVDAIWAALVAVRWSARREVKRLAALPPPDRPGLLAIYTPAWDEAGVVGAMLRNMLATCEHDDYRIYVGCYRNDPATMAEVREVADPRVRLVIGAADGPTTKADCLNRIWERMLADEAAEGRIVKAIILHDAEDVAHPAELRVFDRMIEEFDLIQLPVIPLIHPDSRWVSGHYADEFAESHAKELIVRQWLGAAIPSAGVGCAFSRSALAKMAEEGGGLPFDAGSLTEDYELGLKLRAHGCSQAFVRILDEGGMPVATRGYFPTAFDAAVRQKARWMTGIALSGWDRLGWAGGLAERWMRLRDRQSVLAAMLLVTGYVGFGLALLLKMPEWISGWTPKPVDDLLMAVLLVNFALLVWRLALRFGFVTRLYGWRQGLISIPRVATGNLISILAAMQAVASYRGMARGGAVQWNKTAHVFPVRTARE